MYIFVCNNKCEDRHGDRRRIARRLIIQKVCRSEIGQQLRYAWIIQSAIFRYLYVLYMNVQENAFVSRSQKIRGKSTTPYPDSD